MTRVYLAGPDVFLPEPVEWLERKKAICAGCGLEGVSPLDPLANEPAAWAGEPLWRQIGLRNEAHIRTCAAMLANLTPFRGPSADVGTIYEVGLARGLGLPVFGYATMTTPYLDRMLALPGTHRTGDEWRDADGMLIEEFGLFDNLMIENGVAASGGRLVTQDGDRWRDLSVFKRCAQQVASRIAGAAALLY